jgi:hypothetical protein
MEAKTIEPLSATDVARCVLVIGASAAIGVTAGADGVLRMPLAGAAIGALTHVGASALLILMVHIHA